MLRIHCVFLGVLFFLSTALAGQTIIINTDPSADVYGNGSQPDGSASQGLYYSAVNGNTVILNDDVTGRVYGAYAYDAYGPNTAADNSVILNSGTVTGGVSGGYAVSFGQIGTVAVIGNNVTLDNATVKASVSGGYAYNLQAGTATATGNSVTINSGSDLGSWYAYGGEAHVDGGSGTASANDNSVTINGGTAAGFFGGDASHDGDGTAVANNNRTTINGGMLGGSVFGGRAESSTGTATANGNSMFIRNGTVGSNVYGGFVTGNTGAEATHNTLTLSGSPSFTAGRVNLYGGDGSTTAGVSDFFTGNTLNVWNYSGSSVESVRNFELLNFVFPVIQGNTPVLTVDGAAVLGDSTQGKASIVTASTVGGSTPLQAGDTVTLIDGTIDVSAGFNNQATGQHGATLRYKWELDAANGLVATLNGVQADQRTKALSEGFLSGLALATRGADLVAGAGMRQVVRAAVGFELNTFAVVGGGALRHNTGSHVDMNSFSLMAGLAKGFAVEPGRLALAAFFEYGNGVYDTYNSFSGAASVRGDGHAYSLGGGVLARMDFAETESGNFYAEASARIGDLRNKYRSADLRDSTGNSVGGYDTSSLYYGMHVKGGYLWNLSEKASLDLSAAYLWTGVRGDDVTLATGDPVDFESVDSHRARVGARYAYAATDCLSPYIGATYEYEFGGEARASTYGYAIDAPSLRGGTGKAEIGVAFTPSATVPLCFDLGVQGYIGKREGVTGTCRIQFEF